jgi:hypothetical protein
MTRPGEAESAHSTIKSKRRITVYRFLPAARLHAPGRETVMAVKYAVVNGRALAPLTTFCNAKTHQMQHITHGLVHGRVSNIEELLVM